ncbi:hypothetical protein HMPREF0044_0049 [Gleimia coleocanis DSM 15436]|uniref:DUF3566 domain-containing protein n=1 Tax=Gleimia coleocanis DSM 15436 TaxID=525245 RepID=C0VY09_9ACTO|nr:DUF3566 domain-containing protein [Gleimia coleocanis]EEH64312.1 hypothetical protein HMPREF0044_0049 [Gleimia coleocanis DSM 15436]
MAKLGKTLEVEGIGDDVPRQLTLAVARLDLWSVAKIGFLLSVAGAIILDVVVLVIWLMLDAMHVFGAVEEFLTRIGADSFVSLLNYLHLPQVMSMATLVGVANIVLLTALSMLIALIYNLVATLVGGVRVTLMDE